MKTKEVIAILNDMKGVFDTRSYKQYSLPALDLAIGVFELIEKWGLSNLSLEELDKWRDRGQWHVKYVANREWENEPLEVWVLMKEYLESGEVVFDGVFSNMDKLSKHILDCDESGDYVEYGITKAWVR